ncbi:MAG: class I adenylate cyclase [Deltaproteobacteria bacterium]|nr:class I adenylate cyclase [Deltaproteobacteria bacterium]
MPGRTDPPDAILAELKKLVASPQLDRFPRAAGLVGEFVIIRDEGGHDEKTISRCSSAMAFLMLSLAESVSESQLVGISLNSLQKLGHLGTTLTLRYLHGPALPPGGIKGLVALYPLSRIFLILNQFLKAPRSEEGGLPAWVMETVSAKKTPDPEQILLFLKQVERNGDFLAQPIRDALFPIRKIWFRCDLEKWITSILEQPKTKQDFFIIMMAIRTLTARHLVPKLAEYLKVKDPAVALTILETISKVGQRGDLGLARSVGSLLSHPNASIRLAALDTLNALQPPAPYLSRIYLYLYNGQPLLRKSLLFKLLYLDAPSLAGFLDNLPEESRKEAYLCLFFFLSRMCPEQLSDGLDYMADQFPLEVKANQEIATVIKNGLQSLGVPGRTSSYGATFPAGGSAGSAWEATSGKPVPRPKSFVRLSDRDRELIQNSTKNCLNIENLQLPGADLADLTFRSMTLNQVELRGARIRKVRFENVTIENLDLSEGTVEQAVFEKCRINRLRAPAARISQTTFQGCVLKESDFSNAEFSQVSFLEMEVINSHFVEAALKDVHFQQVLIKNSNLWGTQIGLAKMSYCRLVAVEFSFAGIAASTFKGVEFEDCCFDMVSIRETGFATCSFAACLFSRCFFYKLDTDEFHLLGEALLAQKKLFQAMEQPLKKEEIPQAWRSWEAHIWTKDLVDLWFRQKDANRRAAVLIENDRRRFDWALETLGRPQCDFFRILPYLLHTDILERQDRGSAGGAPLGVSGYHPDYTTLRLVKKYFDDTVPPDSATGPSAIEAIYTIGSLGTFAQTSKSDLDYWICYDSGVISESHMALIQPKLDKLSSWANKKFGLSVFFFLMDLKKVRENNFGFSDEEGSGSAQAQILKEEFYRTTIRIAGKMPAWWLIPPHSDRETYQGHISWMIKGCSWLRDKVSDLGHLDEIAPGEFFGASLWQIVKSLKSPFKSLMKLGLLEKYVAAQDRRARLLCDRIKDNLLVGLTDLDQIDPYVVMFQELNDHFLLMGDQESLDLIKMAFILKSGGGKIDPVEILAPKAEKSILLSRYFREWKWTVNQITELTQFDSWDFKKKAALGDMIKSFILRTYVRIQDSLQHRQADIKINELDLTKLGRRIISNVSMKENKLERLSSVFPLENIFTELHFQGIKAMGQPTVWVVKGVQGKAGQTKNDLVEIKRDRDMARLLAWIIINNLYYPEMVLRTDAGLSPVSAKDVGELLRSLREFFPIKETFETALDEHVKPERVVKVFGILNLLTLRKTTKISEATFIYATNWGEVFSLSPAITDAALKDNPSEFLKKNIKQNCPAELQLKFFVPHQSRCPLPVFMPW